jgi:hypothetical protein
MRAHRMLRAVGRTRRSFEVELTSRLLVAAMLIPLVEALFGWRAHTPLDVPLAVHASILGVMVLLALSPSVADGQDGRVPRAALWLPVPVLAIVFAVLLSARSNVFYTEKALMEGMAVLSIIHFACCWLRRRALARSGLHLVDPAATRVTRLRIWWNGRGSQAGSVVIPAVRLADALSTIVGWSVLIAWVLIALAHRHVVGPLLIIAGALASVALVVLLPDALLPPGRRPWTRGTRQAQHTHPDHLLVVRGDAPTHARHVAPHLRRRS